MYHYWGCTSIYQPLSYPFRSLYANDITKSRKYLFITNQTRLAARRMSRGSAPSSIGTSATPTIRHISHGRGNGGDGDWVVQKHWLVMIRWFTLIKYYLTIHLKIKSFKFNLNTFKMKIMIYLTMRLYKHSRILREKTMNNKLIWTLLSLLNIKIIGGKVWTLLVCTNQSRLNKNLRSFI